MAYLTKEQSERAMHIATRIDLILAKVGKTKGDFTKESGVSSATLSQWRNGTYYPSKSKLDSAAKCLGVSADYLEFGLNGIKENPIDHIADGDIESKYEAATKIQRQLIDKVLEMNNTQARALNTLIDEMLKKTKRG